MAFEHRSNRLQLLSGREVLKALAAIGGAAAASALLPEAWIKPVVEAGVVPAHAQASIFKPPFRFTGCSDAHALWITEPEPTLAIENMAIISSASVGVSLKFSFVLKDNVDVTVYSSGQRVFLTDAFGNADAIAGIPLSQMAGIPYSVYTHWEFADPHDGQTTCDWHFGVPPLSH